MSCRKLTSSIVIIQCLFLDNVFGKECSVASDCTTNSYCNNINTCVCSTGFILNTTSGECFGKSLIVCLKQNKNTFKFIDFAQRNVAHKLHKYSPVLDISITAPPRDAIVLEATLQFSLPGGCSSDYENSTTPAYQTLLLRFNILVSSSLALFGKPVKVGSKV